MEQKQATHQLLIQVEHHLHRLSYYSLNPSTTSHPDFLLYGASPDAQSSPRSLRLSTYSRTSSSFSLLKEVTIDIFKMS